MRLFGAPLSSVAAQAARRFSDRTCLTQGEQSWTFSAFMNEVERLSAGLSERLAKGSRVGLFMSNRPEYLMLQFALERAGLVRVPLNARFTAHEVATVLEDCSAQACFFDSSTFDRASDVVARGEDIWWCQVDGEEREWGPSWAKLRANSGPAPHLGELDDIASINYTSGTSGRPKGAVLTHRNWAALCRNMLIDRDIRTDDVLAHVGPMTHASGTYFQPWFLRGAHSILIENGAVDGLLDAIERQRVTVFTCVPTFLTRLISQPDVQKRDLSSLRAIGYGAEPIPFNTLEKAVALFGPILTQNYGLTEAMMTVSSLPPDAHFINGPDGSKALRVGSIGRPYTFVEVVLRNPDGEPVATGEIGEITIRSDHVMQGYWNRPEETAKVLKDGWLWSGDLASFDAEGLITLAGRSKEMLISGGFNIYPQEIEAVLTSHPCVLEAAVVGAPDPQWGESAVAFVSTLPDAKVSVDELINHLKPTLGFKTPRHFAFQKSLPKNANGKVDKPILRAAARGMIGNG